jgi:hypothetical protein
MESGFLALYKGHGEQSTWDFQVNQGCRTVFQKWGRYSLCEILALPNGTVYYGFYNDMFQWEYSAGYGFAAPSLGAIPIMHSQRASRIAIIGAGGGRQVRLAERLGVREVVAIELEPAVLDAVRSEPLVRKFGRVYEDASVRPVRAEARAFLEQSREQFDLIYLPSVGGYAQMMIEPGNMVRTFQAYRLMRDHLSAGGVLAIWYPRGLDNQGVLTDQYVRTLRSLGMVTEAYCNADEFLILGFRDPHAQPPEADALGAELGVTGPGAELLWPRRVQVPVDPQFTPITDEKPFLAGNVRHILSLGQVRTLFGLAAGVLGLAGVATWLLLRKSGRSAVPGRSFAAVACLALLIGANFLLVEHLLVLALFRRIYVYDDALGFGAVSLLTLSGLGSLLAFRRFQIVMLAAAAGALIVLLALPAQLSAAGALMALAPVALATGFFFPALFERAAANPLPVFALDAIGASFGAIAATFVPILWGFDAMFILAALVFSVTAIAHAVFHRMGRGRCDLNESCATEAR